MGGRGGRLSRWSVNGFGSSGFDSDLPEHDPEDPKRFIGRIPGFSYNHLLDFVVRRQMIGFFDGG